MADILTEILRAANKHPNSRVSKLIHTVEDEPTQKNIVLLLIELSEHAEYSTDFNISLKYYLDLFERMDSSHNLVLNEAGLLLVNSSKIYSKRVDYIQSLVERQILTLSCADEELQKQKLEQQQTDSLAVVEKSKRGRKRALDTPSDPYDVELVPKKFKKLTEEKRFGGPKPVAKCKPILRNIEMEQYIHPAGWQYATIYDLENEEDVDTKRNYKLFTYHVEHRYNTLVPDINFRLHFKMKDYMDKQEEMDEDEACNTDRSWPPLSEAYVQKYINLEDYVLKQELTANRRHVAEPVKENLEFVNKQTVEDSVAVPPDEANMTIINEVISSKNNSYSEESMIDSGTDNSFANSEISLSNKTQASLEASNLNGENDSGLGQSILNETNDTTEKEVSLISQNLNDSNQSEEGNSFTIKNNENLNSTTNNEDVNMLNITENTNAVESLQENDSDLNETTLNQINVTQNDITRESILNLDTTSEIFPTKNSSMCTEDLNKVHEENEENLKIDVVLAQNKDTTQITVHLPCGEDEGVGLSDMEDQDCRLLTPIIKTPNILPGVERKDVTIVMDDELRQALEMRDGIMEHFGCEKYKVSVSTEVKKQKLIFNIMKLPEKQLRRKVLFKLGPDMDIYLQARSLKRCKPEPIGYTTNNTAFLEWHSLNNNSVTDIYSTPPNSPAGSSVFYGFSDDEDDNISCAEFCGFTEEEQSTLMLKHISRLSRDSGVGVEVNNVTPERETLEIIFEGRDNNNSGTEIRNLKETDNTENILNQLSADLRDVLETELKGNSDNKSSTSAENKELEKSSEMVGKGNEEANEALDCSNSETATLSNQSEMLSIGTENDTHASQCSTKTLAGVVNMDELSVGDAVANRDECKESDEELLDRSTEFASNTVQAKSCHSDDEVNDSEDDILLDLDSRGNKTKIQQWHEYLQPILATSRERHHFDVYELGSEIIETAQSRRNSKDESCADLEYSSTKHDSQMASFHDIMDNKDKSYVSRYFLSTLLLANQSNIEISTSNKSSENPSSWHDIHLKLISTKRHTVAIEDNIGMVDKKRNVREECGKQTSNEIGQQVASNNNDNVVAQNNDVDVPLINQHGGKKITKKLKTSLKRNNPNSTISRIAEKKPREVISPPTTTNSRHRESSNPIQSVQILTTPLDKSHLDMNNTSEELSTLHLFNVNITEVRTLQPIEKVQKRCDDHDSGIFSIEESPTS